MAKRGRPPIQPRTCTFCGYSDYYAKGLCYNCWRRKRRNGFLEYKRDRKRNNKEEHND